MGRSWCEQKPSGAKLIENAAHIVPVELTRLRLKASFFAPRSFAGQDAAVNWRVVWWFIVKGSAVSRLIRAAAHAKR
jgi:hypothetical protein